MKISILARNFANLKKFHTLKFYGYVVYQGYNIA